MKKILLVALLLVAIILFSFMIYDGKNSYSRPYPKDNTGFNPEEIIIFEPDSNYISYTDFIKELDDEIKINEDLSKQQVITLAANRKIRIDTAEELYRFSVDVSYHEESALDDPLTTNSYTFAVKEGLLALDYVLGDDIDYKSMRAKQFIPIGYRYKLSNEPEKQMPFTGTFDGRGFEIRNLMLAGLDYLIYDDDIALTTNALTTYFAMFAYNSGTITSLGLVNPNFELLDYDPNIKSFANLVGLNTGTVNFVYVLDTNTNPFEAGIRVRVPSGTTGSAYTAAGIIHSNLGTFSDSYYSSMVVINGNYINSFYVEPVVFNNVNPKDRLVYDSTRYQGKNNSYGLNIDNPTESLATGETATVLNSNDSILNKEDKIGNLPLKKWYHFGNYPTIFGLDYDGTNYLIKDEIDFVAFTKYVTSSKIINGKALNASSYLITDDIDLSRLSSYAIKTLDIDFTGTLSGLDTKGTKKYIKNLNIENGVVSDGNYYSGLFRSISGKVNNIVISNASINITDSDQFYSSTFYIGLLASQITSTAEVNNISINVNINLGTKAIGRTYLGGLVGMASGKIEQIYTTGTINGNEHEFASSQLVSANYTIGGVVGTNGTSKLTLYQIINELNINGISTETNSVISTNQSPIIMIGGIIGHVNNGVHNSIRQVKNLGNITVNQFASLTTMQYIGGIFGQSSGLDYNLSNMYSKANVGENGWANEYWRNNGNVINNTSNSNIVKAAGIGVSNHSQGVEFVYLENNGGFISSSFGNFRYTGLIYDIGTSGVTISQSINTSNFEFEYFVSNFSPVFYSENNSTSLLRYVENSGNIIFRNITVSSSPLNVVGITQSTNVDFSNVYYSGDIVVYGISSSQDINVASITNILNENRYLKHGFNEGNIYVAAISNSANTYVGGLVVENLSGDLNTGSNINASQPKATKGIIDSINYGNISTTLKEHYYSQNKVTNAYGIDGEGNVYVGGISAKNNGSIQDAMNLGNIHVYQASELSIDEIVPYTGVYLAGLIADLAGGAVTGGISAIVTGKNSYIYDAVNSGEVFSMAKNYARSGGILGVALWDEAMAGKVVPDESNDTNRQTRRNEINATVLSNCINFGTIAALTSTIATYSTNTNTANGQRPTIYSCAGGVIGYGLSVMKRMLNHGDVYATDVAGGVVGATYVFGGSNNPRTTVNINTAVHYGSVQAVKADIYNSNTISKENMSKENIRGNNDANMYSFTTTPDKYFYFPNTGGDLTQNPAQKRGFGGVFGRLQRGQQGYMRSNGGSFDYIVNADKNVDMIGRLDQYSTFTISSPYFQVPSQYYFTAKTDDKTQAVFVGYMTSTTYRNRYVGHATELKSTYNYVSYNNRTGIYTFDITHTVTMVNVTHYRLYNAYTNIGGTRSQNKVDILGFIKTLDTYSYSYTERITTSTNYTGQEVITPLDEERTYTESTSTSLSGNVTMPMNIINEEDNGKGKYMYDSDFVMRNPNTMIGNESITSYIYYVRPEVLREEYRTKRPQGMYVLTTTAGSKYGSILPANIELSDIYRLKQKIDPSVNYDTISEGLKEKFGEEFESKRKETLQTEYNEKSELLEIDQNIYLEEEETDNQISNGIVNNTNRTVDFTVNLSIFDPNITLLYLKLGDANISEKSMIAVTNYDSFFYDNKVLSVEEFQELLESEKSKKISIKAEPTFTVDLSNIQLNSRVLIGKIRVYSEAAVSDPTYMNPTNVSHYTTEYSIYITFIPRTTSDNPITISGINVDGSNITPSIFTQNDNYKNYPINNYIRVTYSDGSNLLQSGKDMSKYVKLYYAGTGSNIEVALEYYSITSIPVTNGTYSIQINFTDSLIGGDYKIGYKFFGYEDERYLNISNAKSTSTKILSYKYFGYSDDIGTTNNVINSYIDFNAPFVNGPISFIESSIGSSAYISNYKYTIFGIEDFGIILAPFARLTVLSYLGFEIDNQTNLRIYHLRYTIQNENGQSTTINHYIHEKPIKVSEVRKDDNVVSMQELFASREATQTKFSVSFGFDSSVAPYIYNIDPASVTGYIRIRATNKFDINKEVVGIQYDTNNLLDIYMLMSTIPGTYIFEFQFVRYDGNNIEKTVDMGSIEIEKKLGEDSYLKNIKFTDVVTTSYFDVFEADEQGERILGSKYIMKVFYDGFDYDNSDKDGVSHYRIDGKVPNIPLNYYYPKMVEYLPAGASISRGKIVNGEWVGTNEVYADATEEEMTVLAADYTFDPETGTEGNIVITYRVRSEKGDSFTYYHITVIDVDFNVTLAFEIYYLENGIETKAYQSNELKNKVIYLKVENFVATLDGEIILPTETIANNVSDFLNFNGINGYNNTFVQFNVPSTDEYLYLFGRNMSGFYKISLELPKTSTGLNIYKYDIIFNDQYLPHMNEYVTGEKGLYYYVEASERNRTRNFKIVISKLDEPSGNPYWGLTDYYDTWN